MQVNHDEDGHSHRAAGSLRTRRLARRRGVAIAGEIDRSNVEVFAEIVERLEPGECLDLSELEFMDGSGVRVLLDAARGLQDSDERLTLIAPGYIVRRALVVLAPEELLATIRILDR